MEPTSMNHQGQFALEIDSDDHAKAAAVSLVRLLISHEDFHELVAAILADVEAQAGGSGELPEKCALAKAMQRELQAEVDEAASKVMQHVM